MISSGRGTENTTAIEGDSEIPAIISQGISRNEAIESVITDTADDNDQEKDKKLEEGRKARVEIEGRE